MSRMIGTVSMGVRAPIIRDGDDLAKIVPQCIAEAMAKGKGSRHVSIQGRGDFFFFLSLY